MSEKIKLHQNDIPIIEVNPSNMPLPGVISQINLKYNPGLLVAIRRKMISQVFAVMQKLNETEFPSRLYGVGVIANIEGSSDVDPLVLVHGQTRNPINLLDYQDPELGYWTALPGNEIEDELERFFIKSAGEFVVNPEFEPIIRGLLSNLKHKMGILLEELVNYMDSEMELLEKLYDSFDNLDLTKLDTINELIWYTLASIPEVDSSQKQHVIESRTPKERISNCLDLLEINTIVIRNAKGFEVATKKRRGRKVPTSEINKKDTPDNDDEFEPNDDDIKKRWERYKKIKDELTPAVQKAFMEDFNHLNGGDPQQVDWAIFKNHLDFLLDLYSTVITLQENDISKVEKILGDSHYGLEDIKERIYNYLSTKLRNPKGKGPIICLVGPPGVGKTSIGQSVAESLGRKFIRRSLGGIRDEAEVRGHRATYIGALPGMILSEIRRCGFRNPVFMLDEIDKLSNDFRGDPSSAFLEVLDPAQNHSFQDHYVGAPFDLSDVLFLCTANVATRIQPPLLDRMDVIPISGYTEDEKVEIAKQYLIPKLEKEVGLAKDNIKLEWEGGKPDKVISKIITGYTREAGVRKLEQKIQQVLESLSRQQMKDINKSPVIVVTSKSVDKILRIPKYTSERVSETEMGVTIGLVFTESGNGDIIYVQAQLFPKVDGEKGISQTGQLQEILREANKNALTVVKNLLEENKEILKKLKTHSLHLSIPDGATPKDGPSAGITMATAIYSELTQKRVKPYLAMTGEITIKGKVLAVGGIKEKVLAAYRDGVKEIILPAANRRDYEQDIRKEIKENMIFHFVEHIKDVLLIVFTENSPA